ncbi:MAG: MoxR family ATPase [Clostridiales Family XIII bacterium]|jgi:MoxR-like ATPase|nr:MoxR family ATPase [Clostridiales Family XIII bacterium]
MTAIETIREKAEAAVKEASKAIIGKEDKILLVLVAVLSGGHILLDDLPGAGKTTLVKTMSRILGCGFSRVQFTPDLLPSDITGISVFDQKAGDFRIRPGPIMANIFLADEINRAIPRTQSALLEAMEELQVTIDGETRALPRPFIVMATQNPVESESTFRLPAAQMDRFLFRLSLGYPSRADEIGMLKTVGDGIPFGALAQIWDEKEIARMQGEIAASVAVCDKTLEYIVSLTHATRGTGMLSLPASPRGSRALYRAGKALAAVRGRAFVTPGDIKEMAPYVLPHRVVISGEARLLNKTAASVIEDILETTPVPVDERELVNGGR